MMTRMPLGARARDVEHRGTQSPAAPSPCRRGLKRPFGEVGAGDNDESVVALGSPPAPHASYRDPVSSALAGIPVANDPQPGQRGGDEPAAVLAVPIAGRTSQHHRAHSAPLTRRQLISALSGNG